MLSQELGYKILFVHNHLASFVRTDLELLAARYTVREWFQRGRGMNLRALRRAVAECDLVFGWFASWHTFFPVLLARQQHKPSILVVGGYDVANMPEIGYGSMRGGLKRLIACATLHHATRVAPFSHASCTEVIVNANLSPLQVETIPLGVPLTPPPTAPKQNLALTVGNIDRDNLQRKGIEPFVRAAAHLPDVPFVVVGKWRDDVIDYLKAIASSNVELTGWVDDARLQEYMARAKVYVQASRHEGFGLAVAEAMLYQCVPVVTRVGALPEVVGDACVYLDSTEPTILAEGIRSALTLDSSRGRQARERIIAEFSLARRRQGLFQLIDTIIQRG